MFPSVGPSGSGRRPVVHDTTGQSRTSEPQPGAFSQLMRPVVLREHALIADGERGAVVGPQGYIVWLCVPLWHVDPVFSSFIGDLGIDIISQNDSTQYRDRVQQHDHISFHE